VELNSIVQTHLVNCVVGGKPVFLVPLRRQMNSAVDANAGNAPLSCDAATPAWRRGLHGWVQLATGRAKDICRTMNPVTSLRRAGLIRKRRSVRNSTLITPVGRRFLAAEEVETSSSFL
jgi:hypothetical protein